MRHFRQLARQLTLAPLLLRVPPRLIDKSINATQGNLPFSSSHQFAFFSPREASIPSRPREGVLISQASLAIRASCGLAIIRTVNVALVCGHQKATPMNRSKSHKTKKK